MYKILGSDGNEYGPVSAEQIKQWIAENRVEKKTPVIPEGGADWVFLFSLPEFAAAFAPPPSGSSPIVPSAKATKSADAPAKNVRALVAASLGVFSVIPPFGALLGIPALVMGISGLRFQRRNPAAGGKVHAWIGIILGGLFGFGYLAWIALAIVDWIVRRHSIH
ncbi:MAG: GYF domain-containing protein [Verrucomicrobiota bacterium]|jgi:hypothetical protein